jgi:hypothetical protein
MTEISDSLDTNTTLQRLREWEISGMGLHPGGSNYVFVVRLEDPGRVVSDPDEEDPAGAMYGIYKPLAGERPLRDFPYGTLHLRERASYLLAAELGWPYIPPTVVRAGPHGEGSVQLFIDADVEANYFTLRDDCLQLFEPVAMFDVLVHNADRKGGSCLKADSDGRIWAIDHGLTFNPMAKRRTVMFEFNGQEYPVELLDDVRRIADDLAVGESKFSAEMRTLMAETEIDGLRMRAERMLQSRRFPMLDPNVNVPWPFI